MRALGWLMKKLAFGVSSAIGAVTLSTLAVSVVEGSFGLLDFEAVIRVGLPSFVAGMLFFPMNEAMLATRRGFSLRVGLAAFAAALVHRVLLFSVVLDTFRDVPVPFSVDGLNALLAQPWLLMPQGLDWPFVLETSAVTGAALAAYLLQPALLSVAKGRRRMPLSVSRALESTRSRPLPMIRG